MALGEAKGSERNGQDAGKRGQLCGAGVAAGAPPSWRSPLRTDPSSEQSTHQKHLKYGWLSEFHRHNTFQGRSYVSSEVYL